MEEPVFFSWFVDQFIPHLKKVKELLPNVEPTQKALLMFDGHKSHISARLVKAAIENQIILFRLPSHLTHRLQPLDFSVFGPLKTGWNRILLAEMRKCLGVTNKDKMSKKDFSIAVKNLWVKYLTPDIIISGFIGTGSLPVDPTKFPQDYYDQVALARYKSSIKQHVTAEDQSPLMNANELSRENDGTIVPMVVDHTEPVLSTGQISENINKNQISSCSNNPSNETANGKAARRSVIDFFVNKIKATVESSVTSTPKEKQIRLKQLQYGEVLTSEQVLERLRQEEERRKSKAPKRKSGKEGKNPQTRPKKKY